MKSGCSGRRAGRGRRGGVVIKVQPLMIAVPDEATVTAEVMHANKDIGFMRPGQEAEIELETFLFTRYGTVPVTCRKSHHMSRSPSLHATHTRPHAA